MDEYPNGTNAVVAVLSYTGVNCCDLLACFTEQLKPTAPSIHCPPNSTPPGYDMEDAMILNKSSVERGFAHASVYKSVRVDLKDEKGR